MPGNACCMRSYAFTTASDFGNVSGPGRDHAQLQRRQRRARASSPPARTADSSGPPQDAVDDRAPDPALAAVAAEPADERDAHPVDPVAEPREQGGQDGQRAEHRDRRRRAIVATPNDANVASPVRNMPAIATITVRPEMSTERPEVAAAASSAASLAPSGGALLARPLQIEHRVVDADREPDQQHERGRLRRRSAAGGSAARSARTSRRRR